MVRIEVVSTEIREMKGTSQKSGKAYDLAMQDAYLHKGEVYPEKIEVSLKRSAPGGPWVVYPVGDYIPTAASYQSRDGKLAINGYELTLVALPKNAKAV